MLFILHFLYLSEVTLASGDSKQSAPDDLYLDNDIHDEIPNLNEEHSDSDHDNPAAENVEDYTKLSERQKKWIKLRNKMVNY